MYARYKVRDVFVLGRVKGHFEAEGTIEDVVANIDIGQQQGLHEWFALQERFRPSLIEQVGGSERFGSRVPRDPRIPWCDWAASRTDPPQLGDRL